MFLREVEMGRCLTSLVNHPQRWGKGPQEVVVGRCVTWIVNHPPGVEEPSKGHAAGRLSSLHVFSI